MCPRINNNIISGRTDPPTCWIISASVLYVYLKNFRCLQWDSNQWPLQSLPVQWSYKLSYEATQMWAGQFVGLMCSRERNDEWKKCFVKCGWEINNEEMIFTLAGQSQLHIWDNCWDCLASMMIISSIHQNSQSISSIHQISQNLSFTQYYYYNIIIINIIINVIIIIPWLCIMQHKETVMLQW